MKLLETALKALSLPFELAPLQASDCIELAPSERNGLFLEVGCGKTVMSTVLATMWERPHNIIAMPPILLEQWSKWLNTVDPENKTAIHYGPRRDGSAFKAKWVLTSHAIFRDDFKEFTQHFVRKDYTTIIDEAQNLKNVGSKLFRYTKSFSAGQPLALLTGTPTTKPVDAYAYIDLKTPKLYRSLGHFENLHVAERDFFGSVTEWRDLETVSERLMLQSVKRTKEEVFKGQLNPPEYIPMEYRLDPKHYKLYTKLVEECLLDLEISGQKIDGTTPQRLYHLVQQIIVNWAMFSENANDVPKIFELIAQTIEETDCMSHGKSKLIVWTYYQPSTKYVYDKLHAEYPGKVVIAYGKSDSHKAVDRFMNDPDARIGVFHPLSVGMGLNAMDVCWEMIFAEFSTVPMHIKQSIGRVDRMGQKHIPNIRFAIAKGTVQERLMQNLLKADETVAIVERNKETLRAALLGG